MFKHLRLYRAGCPDGFPGDRCAFITATGLFSIPEVAVFAGRPGFKTFSVDPDGLVLMAEYHGGGTWDVVGYLSAPVAGLPAWQYKHLAYA